MTEKLIVVPEEHVKRYIEQGDLRLIISVGHPYSGTAHIPVIRVARRDIHRVSSEEKDEAFSAAHQVWSENGKVLFHCLRGEDRSPTFAGLCLAEYYGKGREEEALEHVIKHTIGRKRKLDEGILESVIPLLKDDDVAIYFLINKLAQRLNVTKRNIYTILQHRKILKQGGNLQDLWDAMNQKNIPLGIHGLPDEKLNPISWKIRMGTTTFYKKWLHSEETLESLGPDYLAEHPSPTSRRDICLTVLKA